MSSSRWTLPDLLDFELLLEQDRHCDPVELEERDRDFVPGAGSRADLFQAWLLHRRSGAVAGTGRRFEHALGLASWIGILCSCATGVGIALGFLRYRGEVLINVTAFLAVAVGLQLLGLAGTALLWMWRRVRPLAGGWLLDLLRVPAARRQLPLSLPLLQQQIFGLLQGWGVALNLGILACLLFRVTFYDLAFGWASTLDVSPEAIHRLVETLACPWRPWFPAAVPTLEQIAGSRIVLSEGLATTSVEGVTAWWRFLAMGVLVYGGLPRSVLWIASALSLRGRLARLSFSSAACESLELRLRPALVEHPENPISSPTTPLASPAAARPIVEGVQPFELFLPDEIPLAASKDALARGFGLPLSRVVSDVDGLTGTSCLLVQEAWRPPLEETLTQLRSLRKRMKEDAVLLIGLIGMVEGDAVTVPDPLDVETWNRVLARGLQDAAVGVRAWQEPEQA